MCHHEGYGIRRNRGEPLRITLIRYSVYRYSYPFFLSFPGTHKKKECPRTRALKDTCIGFVSGEPTILGTN